MLNQLRFSLDPVALDMLSIKELERQRRNAVRQRETEPGTLSQRVLARVGRQRVVKMHIERPDCKSKAD